MNRSKAFLRRQGSSVAHRPSVTWSSRGSVAGGHKPHEDGIRREDKSEKEALVGQEIGLLYGGSLVMNAIIGPGIFGTPKGVLAGVGSIGLSLIMWTFAGVFSMCAALCFAELRESVQREGVEYAYITEAFGPLTGFVYSWIRIAAAEPCSTAVFALAFTDYVADAVYDKCGPPPAFVMVVASMAVLSMALINVMSTKLAEKFQMLATVGKIITLSVVVIMGIKRLSDGHGHFLDEGMKGTKWSPTDLAFACYNGLWAYGGWSNVNQVTSGIKKPPRNVPRIVKTVLPFVLIIYLLTVISYFTVMSKEELLHSQAIGVTWAQTALGPASSMISIGVGLIALGSVNATFLSSGRLSGVAAKNGQMPDVVSWVHVRSKTPLITVASRCVITIVLMSVANGQELLRFYIFTVWLFHGSSILALLVLRFKKKSKNRPYMVDLWIPVIVVIGIAYLLLAPFLEAPKKEFIAALALIGLSLISYYPINWLKAKKMIDVPDNITIWLQLFLRIAPKRDLRRERRSLMKTMNMITKDSIIITPGVGPSDDVIRRFSRRMSPFSRVEGSPAVIRRLVDESGQLSLRRRLPNGGSLGKTDFQSKKRSTIAAIIREGTSSPAIIRKKESFENNTLGHYDLAQLRSPPSLPIFKNRFYTTPETPGDSAGSVALSPLSSISLHPGARPQPTTIPEEEVKDTNTSALDPTEQTPEDFQVVAGFESDGGGEYEVLAHPEDVQRVKFTTYSEAENSSSSSDLDSESDSCSSSIAVKRSVLASLFASSTSSDVSSSDDEYTETEEEGGPSNYFTGLDQEPSNCEVDSTTSSRQPMSDQNLDVYTVIPDSQSYV